MVHVVGAAVIPAFLLAILLAGCVDRQAPPATEVPGPLFAPPLDAALWDDPQLFPHPRFNWPTLTHVPAHAPTWWRPIAPVDMPVLPRSFEHVSSAPSASSGADGMALFGHIAVTPGAAFLDDDLVHVMDISAPEAPTTLATFQPEVQTRAAEIIAYPDGRLILLLTGSEAAGVFLVYDITDPTAPESLAVVDVPSGTHNVAVVPGTPIVYNANTVGSGVFQEAQGGRSLHQTEIYDLTDPEEPVLVKEWQNGHGCHDISFHIDAAADRYRAYCAAIDTVQIWDIRDPLAPSVISTFPFPLGAPPVPGTPPPAFTANAHSVVVNRAATVIAVSDEVATAPPACGTTTDAVGTTLATPTGNLWFYDVSDERAPVQRGRVSSGTQSTDRDAWECTAHLGRMVPHPTQDLLVMTFYSGGLALIDFTDAAAPHITDLWTAPGRAVADAWYVQGYVVTSDFRQGFDVFRLR